MPIAKRLDEEPPRMITKESQTHKKRLKPRGSDRGKFSQDTIDEIFERDNGQCVRCRTYQDLESVPHHIVYKSQLGKGTVDNGATVCRTCHRLAHEKKEIRKWFEQYREEKLITKLR